MSCNKDKLYHGVTLAPEQTEESVHVKKVKVTILAGSWKLKIQFWILEVKDETPL